MSCWPFCHSWKRVIRMAPPYHHLLVYRVVGKKCRICGKRK